jgi:hypothetical protein
MLDKFFVLDKHKYLMEHSTCSTVLVNNRLIFLRSVDPIFSSLVGEADDLDEISDAESETHVG